MVNLGKIKFKSMFSLFTKKKEVKDSNVLNQQVKEAMIEYFSQSGFDYRPAQIHAVNTDVDGKRIIANVELSYPAILIGKNGIVIKGLGAYMKGKISSNLHINLVESNPFKGIEEKWR